MPLVLIILVGVLVAGSATTVSTDVQLYTDVGGDDKAFSESLIFEEPAASAVHCAAICKQQPRCETFTFGQGVCRGHIMLVTIDSYSTPAPGARTFVRDWVSRSCTDDDQCPARHSECYFGRCVCSPGYYYSLGTKGCTDSCQESDLQPSLTEYWNSDLLFNDFAWVSNSDPSECQELCVKQPKCRTAVLNLSIESTCFLKNVTKLTAPPPLMWETRTEGDNWILWQRTCV